MGRKHCYTRHVSIDEAIASLATHKCVRVVPSSAEKQLEGGEVGKRWSIAPFLPLHPNGSTRVEGIAGFGLGELDPGPGERSKGSAHGQGAQQTTHGASVKAVTSDREP